MNARLYDPFLGQFISVDPLADKYPGWGAYVYCANNPLKYIDPTGEWYYDFWGDLREEEYDDECTLGEFYDNLGVSYNPYDLSSLYSSLKDGNIDSEYILDFLVNSEEGGAKHLADYKKAFNPNNTFFERFSQMLTMNVKGMGDWKAVANGEHTSIEGDGYGDVFSERVSNPELWKKLGYEALFGKDYPNVIKLSMADNPISFLMPFGQFSKASLGLKTLGGASKTTMVTTTFFKEIGASGSLGGRWFTPLGAASNWETFLGRWTPFFMESGLIYDYSKNKDDK